ncbi:MAG TPA: hypothetical protein PKV72_03745 [Candidatus Peribacteria bacterium]|nr:hypothetical protein [Candidatus Peribacteria bacterium]
MMPPLSGTGSQLDTLLPAAGAVAPRPPEQDVKAARVLAAQIEPASMANFLSGVRTQTHNQLEALAFVLHEEYPNRINEQIKKEVATRLVALRQEVAVGQTNLPESVSDTAKIEAELKRTENRLEWVRRLLTLPTAPATVTPVVPVTAAPEAPTFLSNLFGGVTSRVMAIFSGRPATEDQAAKVEAQSKALAGNLATAGERLLDNLISSPDALARVPVIGAALAAPVNAVAALMGFTPAVLQDRRLRRESERAFRGALVANNVVSPVTVFDENTWNALKAVQPPRPVTTLLQEWVKAQRDNGVSGPLTLSSPMDLLNVELLRKQLQDKRSMDARTTLVGNIGTRLRRTVSTLTNGTEVQMQSSGGSIALTARVGDLTPPAVLPGQPVGTPPPVPVAGVRDFDDNGAPVSPEAKTLAGAMIKFPRATKIRIVASGMPEMTAANEYVIPVGAFDEAGVAVSNEAKTLVGMSVRFPNATKLRLAAAGGNYEMTNLTEFMAVTNSFNENGSPSNAGRQFDNAIRTLTGATKITIQPNGNAEILNQTEFNIPARSTTRIADLAALANLGADERVQQITINTGMQREVPLLAWRDNGTVEINAHDNSVARIVAAGGWSSILNRISVGRSINLQTMTPIGSSSI